MLLYGSRYTFSTVLKVTAVAGSAGLTTVLDRRRWTTDDLTTPWSYRKMPERTELDSVANRICGKEHMWFLIADLNKIVDPFEDTEAGEQLVVPSRQAFLEVFTKLSKGA